MRCRVIYIHPIGPHVITAFADRLRELIKESNNPHDDMLAIESCLDEQGLWDGGFASPPSPDEFVARIIEENPLMQEALASVTITFTPKRIETIGDLLTYIPSFK